MVHNAGQYVGITSDNADGLSAAGYDSLESLERGRADVVARLADFMGWPVRVCPTCFDGWRESSKGSVEERLGWEAVGALEERMLELEGVWPPRRVEDGERGCRP